MDAVISAGGKGTRLGILTEEIPKALILIAGKPVLQYQLEELERCGVEKVWLLTGYLNERIEAFLRRGNYPFPIEIISEPYPLGTAGGLATLRGRIEASFFFIYGDIIFSVDLKTMAVEHHAKGNQITMFVHPNSHPYDSDIVSVDVTGRVTAILPKHVSRPSPYDNLVNSGIYILEPSICEVIEPGVKRDFEKDIVSQLTARFRVGCYRSTEYVKDMGTLDRLVAVEQDLALGVVERRRRTHPQKAIFLDRDGTINRHVGLLTNVSQLELLPGAAEAISLINRSDFLCFIVSNQPAVARNLCTIDDIRTINRQLEVMLGEAGAYVDDIRFCPHHPDIGYIGENPYYKIICECRKPGIGMLSNLSTQYHIDLSASYLIGDTSVDVQTALNAGVNPILVETGEGGRDGKYAAEPSAIFPNLYAAVLYILEKEE